tara:strand:- start:495 stop:2243 length:1749 start_codon:yes stop_codon:yes gene_type:complete
VITSSRIGIALLLALLVPAAFTSAWAWLVHGGPIENAVSNELADEVRCRDTVTQHFGKALRAASKHGIALQIDEAGFVRGPFLGRPATQAEPPTAGLAEATAKSALASGDKQRAAEFFAHAYTQGQLTAEGSLIYATLLRPEERSVAADVLAAAEGTFADTWCGSLPFSLLLALHRVRYDLDTEHHLDTALLTAQQVDAAAIPAVLAELVDARPSLSDDSRIAMLRAAASAFLQLTTTPATTYPLTLADGTVVLPHDAFPFALFDAVASVVALPAQTVTALLSEAAHYATEQHPDLTVTLPNVHRDTWSVARLTMPTSTLLTYVARTCLALAIATLLLGNLLLWRLSRRELALVRMRRDFVDVVSHELRTPLTALSLKAEMLASGDVPANRQPHYLQTLNRDVHRLTDQVERILDFGRLERGAALHREIVPTRSVLAKGLRAGMPALRLVKQNVTVTAPRNLPLLDGDVDVLARALRNLLENAAKYAPPGSTVALRAFTDGSTVSVEVADTGPGVAHDERQAIFQPFVRASSATPGIQGSGLGLALVSAAAKAHGGSIDVRDREGGGTVFTLQLPIAKESAS